MTTESQPLSRTAATCDEKSVVPSAYVASAHGSPPQLSKKAAWKPAP